MDTFPPYIPPESNSALQRAEQGPWYPYAPNRRERLSEGRVERVKAHKIRPGDVVWCPEWLCAEEETFSVRTWKHDPLTGTITLTDSQGTKHLVGTHQKVKVLRLKYIHNGLLVGQPRI